MFIVLNFAKINHFKIIVILKHCNLFFSIRGSQVHQCRVRNGKDVCRFVNITDNVINDLVFGGFDPY